MSPDDGARRLRVGHLVDCFGAGGIATGVFTLIGATSGLVDHTIISLSDDLRLLDELPTPAPACVLKPGPTKLVGFSLRLASLVRRERIDILHCNNQFAWLDACLAGLITGRPCLQTFHGVEQSVAEIAGHERWKCRLAARMGSRITAVSAASRRMVCALSTSPETAVEVIPNGVDLDRFRPAHGQEVLCRGVLRRELAVGPDADLVVHVAGLRPVKDQETLLRAWRIVIDSMAQTKRESLLLIVGEGPRRAALEALAEELHVSRTVRFLGQRRDLEELLPACDLFVLCSISEGLSFAILEAMACGLPVVATQVGGNGELVEDGVTGLLAPPRDPAPLASRLRELLDQPQRRLHMGARGRDAVETGHDASKMAARYVDLYHSLARDVCQKGAMASAS